MRNRRKNWLLRRLVLGFAIALVVVPAAQARPEGALPPLAHAGADTQGTFVPGVTDFPGSSYIAPEHGALVRGDYKDGVGTSPGTVVIVSDDKQNIGTRPAPAVLVGDDKQNVPLGRDYEPTVAAEYNQYTYRRALPQDLGPQAAILAELDAKTREYVAGAAPVVSEPVEVVSNPSKGFDWGDAGIGAGTVFALILVGAGALLATRHVGHPAHV